MFIKKFTQFIIESIDNSEHLLYYAFDWDDNILMMPTKIIMKKRVEDDWVDYPVSTAEFAEVRTDTENWKIDYDTAFIEFRDQGERGDMAFLEDVKSAISQNRFGPAWEDFIECLVNGSVFAIITARGHESSSMKRGVEWIIDNVLTESQLFEMYNNLRKFEYFYGKESDSERILTGIPSQNPIIQKYLDSCDFIGVSAPSRGGSPANPEKAKEEALLLFKQKVNDYAQRLGKVAKVGFSDDDLKNVKHIEDLVDSLHNEQFPNIIEIVVKGTKDPLNITKKVVKRGEQEITETSHQTPGLENSVLTCTQFGNQAGRLNPQGPINRQDDFANQFNRQVNYLTKTSKEIFKDKKSKKIKKSSK
jgi:hypothetical protein